LYLLYRLGVIGNRLVKVKLRSGCEVHVPLDKFGRIINAYYDNLIKDVYFDDKGLFVDFMGIKFRDVFRSMVEVFLQDQWGFLNVKGKHVVDVGAFVGDSSIYFALKGAERVIAIEPHPVAYQEMLENIKLNDLEAKITPINVALGQEGYIEIPFDVPLDYIIDKIYEERSLFIGTKTVRIKSITLSDLMRMINIRPDVLKLDCEGCEYDVILNDYQAVKLFEELAIECHPYITGKCLDEVLGPLTKDFRCKLLDLGDRAIVHCIKRGS